MVPIDYTDGEPLAVILADASLERHPWVLATAAQTGALALENARLPASLLARIAEVQDSRARIVEAALAERRRVEQDLHDGAQQLPAVAVTLAPPSSSSSALQRAKYRTGSRRRRQPARLPAVWASGIGGHRVRHQRRPRQDNGVSPSGSLQERHLAHAGHDACSWLWHRAIRSSA